MSKLDITEDGHIQYKQPEVNIYSKPQWKVTYNHGWGDQTRIVNADTEDEAKRMGLAEFRRNTGSVFSVDDWPMDTVIKSVEKMA